MIRSIFLVSCLLALAGCQGGKSALPIPEAEEDALLRKWISTLSSDAFGGRMPMTPYEDKTVSYLAAQLDSLGIEPAFSGSYFQEVKLISTRCSFDGNGLSFQGKKGRGTLRIPEDFVGWTARPDGRVDLSSRFVFCGFGINAPEFGWNDFDGIDVKGKIVLVLVNDPGFYDESLFQGKDMTYYGRWTYKFEQAARLEAAACLVIHDTAAAGYGWNVCSNHTGANLALYDEAGKNASRLPMNGWLHEDGCRKLFACAGMDFDQALEAAKHPGFKPFELDLKGSIAMDVTHEIRTSRNVGGILPGREFPDEAVVFSGHWDHLGIGTPDEKGDSIYNGAADNASGMAATLLCAAQGARLKEKPRRSLLFLFYTSEESGLFGSESYCTSPAVPLDKTLACINFESMAPESLTKDVVVLGGGKTILDGYIEEGARAQGWYVTYDTDTSDGWFFRSDHFNFVKKGVPAVVIEPGTDPVDPDRPNPYPFASWYHKPCDEYHPDWDLEGSLAHIHLMFGVGLSLADREGLKTGDLVFVGIPADYSLDDDSMDSAISESTGGKEGLNLIHVAIAEVSEGRTWIIDATLKHGVDRHPLDTFLTDFTLKDGSYPVFQVMRLKDDSVARSAVERAKTFVGTPYDVAFQPDNGALYCTELVQVSYLTPGGERIFPSAPMNFKNAEGEFPVYWTQLFNLIGQPIPQDVPGTNPQAMSLDPHLCPVGTSLR